jgi:hypothetical protein
MHYDNKPVAAVAVKTLQGKYDCRPSKLRVAPAAIPGLLVFTRARTGRSLAKNREAPSAKLLPYR